jgi:hypothetical protein
MEFTDSFNPIKPNITLANNLINYIRAYELRDDHPLILNSPYLGTHRLVFKPSDISAIYDMFNIDIADLMTEIIELESYNDYKVAGDIFNISSIYIAHIFFRSYIKMNNKIQEYLDAAISIIKLLSYKFLSSKLFVYYRYGVNEDVMRYTFESFNNRFDIIKYGTWRNLITERSKVIFDSKSIHKNSIIKFHPDSSIYYVITDTQTKLRSILSIIYDKYKKNLEANNAITSYDASSTINGEKILKDSNYVYDSMLYYLINNSQTNSFVNETYVKALLNRYYGMSYPMAINFLKYLMDIAKLCKKEFGENVFQKNSQCLNQCPINASPIKKSKPHTQ